MPTLNMNEVKKDYLVIAMREELIASTKGTAFEAPAEIKIPRPTKAQFETYSAIIKETLETMENHDDELLELIINSNIDGVKYTAEQINIMFESYEDRAAIFDAWLTWNGTEIKN